MKVVCLYQLKIDLGSAFVIKETAIKTYLI